MKPLLCTAAVVLFSICTLAQPKIKSPKGLNTWSSGTVILQTGDTIACRLKYNYNYGEGFLHVEESGSLITLTAKDVKGFSYLDEKSNRMRKFYAFSLYLEQEQKEKTFFLEHVYGNSNLTIVNLKTIDLVYEYMEYVPFKRKGIKNKKFLLDIRSGELLPMCKENALKLLQEQKQQVLSYIHNSGLKFRTIDDYINLFEYYRSL